MCFYVDLLLRGKEHDRIIVSNDPVNRIDPLGLFDDTITPALIGGAFRALATFFAAKAAKETADAIKDSAAKECDDPCKPDDSEECQQLAKKIENLRKEVYEKRIPDLEGNPGNLPERIGPGEKLRDTVRGHRTLLNRQWRRLRELEDKYDRKCKKHCKKM